VRRSLLTFCLLVAVFPAHAAANPIIPGDHPDPTVVQRGGDFYVSATAGSWAPLFNVFHSRDLVNWRQVGGVLPRGPRWAGGDFWAPDLSHDGSRFHLYYSANWRRGRKCIAHATAVRAEGPWSDEGWVSCPPGGALDATAVTDETGQRWIVWKGQGWGKGLFAQRLDELGVFADEQIHPLIKPDQRWERGVTEGAELLRRNGWWYLFYAGANCCRPPCRYVESVARARSLTGPYEKIGRPLMASNASFRCPGHGSIVDLGARGMYLVHHGYRPGDRRRHVLLTKVDWGDDGWPVLAGGDGPDATAPSPFGAALRQPAPTWRESFRGSRLPIGFVYHFDRRPHHRVRRGRLRIRCDGKIRYTLRQVLTGDVVADAHVRPAKRRRAWIGLVASAGRGLRGLEVDGRRARSFVWTGVLGYMRNGRAVKARLGDEARLRIRVENGRFSGRVSRDGRSWRAIDPGPASKGSPALRVGVSCRGAGTAAVSYVTTTPIAPAPA
jgi:beta-xylosidase